MDIYIEDIDVDRLRRDLIDYFTSAMFVANPVAIMDLTKVENASDEEVIRIAIKNSFDITKYIKQRQR